MNEIVKSEIGLVGNYEILKKRIGIGVNINIEKSLIFVHFKEVEYYIDSEGLEVQLHVSEVKTYKADFESWMTSPVGTQIKGAIELRLQKADPIRNMSAEEIQAEIDEQS